MKRTAAKMILLGILTSSLQLSAYAMSQNNINMIQADQGIVTVQYKSSLNKKLKLVIEKAGERYTYNINNNEEYEHFPLQMGNGKYKIGIYENTTGNKYRLLTSQTSDVQIKDATMPFLHATQNIAWNEESKAILLADSLLENEEGFNTKVQLIHQFIIESVKYDYEKVTQLESSYLPNIDDVLESGKGICYDISSLFAAMLRSQKIPTKLVMGYRKDIEAYHSWNEVYDAEKDEWLIIDLVYDMYAKEKGYRLKMIKDPADYYKVKEY